MTNRSRGLIAVAGVAAALVVGSAAPALADQHSTVPKPIVAENVRAAAPSDVTVAGVVALLDQHAS